MKCGIVDVSKGEMVTERLKILTPKPATPEAVAEKLLDFVHQFNWSGLIGCGVPSVIREGVARTAANIDPSWIGTNVEETFSNATGLPVIALNDADAAGTAEIMFGAGKSMDGIVLMLTIGTGIGSALFYNGMLVPNSEYGHLYFKGDLAEKYCSNFARESLGMSWAKWGKRLNRYLLHLQRLLSPDAIIIGGGISKDMGQFERFLKLDIPVLPALTQNQAGVIGAAVAAHRIQLARSKARKSHTAVRKLEVL